MQGPKNFWYVLDEISGPDSRDGDAPSESMRGRAAAGLRRRPSTDDKRIRRRMRRGGAVAQEETPMTPQERRGALMAALKNASTLQEQAALVAQLDDLERGARRQSALDAELDLTSARITEMMTPVVSRTARATGSSDWLMDLAEAAPLDHNAIVSQAALWFQQVPERIREDPQEFDIQAHSAAQVHTGSVAGVAIFADYAKFLRDRTAASGVPQIQQTTAPDGVTSQPTPLPPEVFDNFAPPVADINAGADGAASSSDRAPAIQQAVNGGGNNSPEQPGGHSETDELTGPAPEPSLGGGGGSGAPEEPGGHTGTDTGTENTGIPEDPKRHQAASGLPMIQQTKDTDDAPSATPMPDTVAFPWTMGGPEDGLEGSAHYDQDGTAPPVHQSTGVRRTADQWTQPSPVIHPGIANSPATDPPRTPADAGSGAADAADPQAQPSFGDAHAAHTYTDSYNSGHPAKGEQDVPVSLGGDNGQSHAHPAYASQRIASQQDMAHPDFQRGYKYAAKWRPGVPLVRTGSAELEAGIYAAFTDRPQHRTAWLAAHTVLGESEPTLGQRIAMHRQFTHQVAAEHGLPTDGTYLQVRAATGVDLDSTGPGTSPSPTGDTPINGPGRPGPLAGGSDPAASGGPSPYNGAQPTGSPVVPAMGPVPSSAPATVSDSSMAVPTHGLGPAAAAFRSRVQAGLLRDMTDQEG